jgi:hypothetical protein
VNSYNSWLFPSSSAEPVSSKHLNFTFQYNVIRIALQGRFKTGRKFARKVLHTEFLQAPKIVDITMVGRFSEESLYIGG